MSLTDPISDMLTRIRNAVRNKERTVVMPGSRMKVNIAKVLRDEGYLEEFAAEGDGPLAVLQLSLKYDSQGTSVIQGIQRFSKPGCRRYRGVQELPRVLGGLGIAILSTNKGIISDRAAREQNVGGEVLCTVY